MWRPLFAHLAFQTDDDDLIRAQFQSLTKQIPLIYMILICNALVIAIEFYRADLVFLTLVMPLCFCSIAALRACWWWKRRSVPMEANMNLVKMIRRTCSLAVVMTLIFTGWCLAIYPLGTPYTRGHLTFFLGLTLVSSVFCLLAVRVVAIRVAATSCSLFVGYFAWVEDGEMLSSSLVLLFVTVGMIVVASRYNEDFSELIRSQRDLKNQKAEAERLSEENRRVAFTDQLSGLPNRRKLLSHLNLLEQRPHISTDSQAVMFIDLDGFKDINDAHGHQAGDALISEISSRLQSTCPDFATLTRIGGDEFAILIETPHATQAAQELANKVSAKICQPLTIDGHVLQVGASIGIASNFDGQSTGLELLRRADMAMYHVKTGGKGKVALYDASFDQGRLHRLEIEQQIGRGLRNGEFEVHYQPLVNAETGEIIAAEALLRWPRRREGQLNPQRIVEVAEMTGQIHPLGQFVLERACRDFALIEDLKVSVNVSPSQFQDPGFSHHVDAVLRDCGLPHQRLQLEITEGYLLTNPERAIAAVSRFKKMGMSVALDDFGTGFTSIHYLRSYGFSHIKIDKSLITGLTTDSNTISLITGAIYLARGLNLRVIVEGVETEDQAQILRAIGCHNMQGYHFGRPMPFDEFVRLCKRNAGTSETELRKIA
ncbi:EAL domain-containing protein [Porphyrobacter algicida]|uniref:EAL domain-containing protein n=1 Tax=Qipengyuania algicida TaxID=1836209 RepID=A0A845ADQ5_9SPHN|nr:EAL domain-containing protein [Qipengyuania algicida]MXP27519.1 EAL domain-containing protein [Qipengyuania algicida]